MVDEKVFDNLETLQGVLAKKYSLEQIIEESPKELSAQAELLARMKKEYNEKNTKFEEVRATVAHLQAERAETERIRSAGEKGMDDITTHREFEALEKQISDAKEKGKQLDRELQKEEKNLSELKEQLETDEAVIQSQEADLAKSNGELQGKIDAYKEQLAKLEAEEKAISPSIDREIVYKFQRIIRRDKEGIVPVKNGVCTGCHMILPAQFANEVRAGKEILFCPYCSRILRYQDVTEDDKSYQAVESTGSLVGFADDEFVHDEMFGDAEDGDEFEIEVSDE